MQDNRPWKLGVDVKRALKANVDDAVLVVQLGIVVTAIRAAQRLTIATRSAEDQPPSAQGTRLWAFLLALAYLHEARVTIQAHFPKVKALALEAGATDEDARQIGALLSGKTGLGDVMSRVRNQLVFHFDEDAVRRWVIDYDGDFVHWADGIGPQTGNVLYRASTDAVAAGILPGSDREDNERFVRDEVLPAMERLPSFLEKAIAGYLKSVGATATYTS